MSAETHRRKIEEWQAAREGRVCPICGKGVMRVSYTIPRMIASGERFLWETLAWVTCSVCGAGERQAIVEEEDECQESGS